MHYQSKIIMVLYALHSSPDPVSLPHQRSPQGQKTILIRPSVFTACTYPVESWEHLSSHRHWLVLGRSKSNFHPASRRSFDADPTRPLPHNLLLYSSPIWLPAIHAPSVYSLEIYAQRQAPYDTPHDARTSIAPHTTLPLNYRARIRNYCGPAGNSGKYARPFPRSTSNPNPSIRV